MARIWRWPPDRVRAAWRRRSARSGKAREDRLDPLARAPRRRDSHPSRGSPRTLRVGKTLRSCGTKADAARADLARRPARESRRRSRRTRPRLGVSSPAMTLSSVDLPAPFGPITLTISPAASSQVHALEHVVGAGVAGDDARRHSGGPPATSHVGLLHPRVGGHGRRTGPRPGGGPRPSRSPDRRGGRSRRCRAR